jgi:hypothetical protein
MALQLNFIINKKLVEKGNKFFEKKPLAFISQILENLRSVKLPAKEIIFLKGFISSEIYFISKGHVSIYNIFDNTEVSLLTLVETEYFGDVGVMLGEPRSVSAKTLKYSELLILTKEDLFDALRGFEELKEEMINEAKKKRMEFSVKFEKFSREFQLNRELVHGFPGNGRNRFDLDEMDLDEEDKFETLEVNESLSNVNEVMRIKTEEKLSTIRNVLSKKTLKMIDPGIDIVTLKEKVQVIEDEILNLMVKYQLTCDV